MHGNIASMACDTYGSHVVQKALDLVDGFDSVVVAESVFYPPDTAAVRMLNASRTPFGPGWVAVPKRSSSELSEANRLLLHSPTS